MADLEDGVVRHMSFLLMAALAIGSLPGCSQTSPSTPTRSIIIQKRATPYVAPTFPPTWTPRPPTPTNTRVIPIAPTFTPGPSPTPTLLPPRTKALVVGIQDSYTIEVLIEGEAIDRGFPVRLLGIEPPLLSDPWSEVALNWLAREIERHVVVLERDEEEQDTQGNLLRYVWYEGHMINVRLVQLGLASISENVESLHFGADLQKAEADARGAQRGMWGPPPTPTPTRVTATLPATQILIGTPSATPIVTTTLTSP